MENRWNDILHKLTNFSPTKTILEERDVPYGNNSFLSFGEMY